MAKLFSLVAGADRWHVDARWSDLLLGPRGLLLDEWLGAGQASVIKQGPHCGVYRVILPQLDFHVKHYRMNDARAHWRRMLRSAKADMEHDRALAVAARGIPTVTPIGRGERYDGSRPGDSFLLTRTLEDAEPLGQFIEHTLPGFADARRVLLRQRLALSLARFVARMHDAGVVHHDFHAGNVLVRLGADDRLEFFLIDLHAVRVGTPLDWRASRANLIMLNRWFVLRVDRSDRLRFWREYSLSRADAGWVATHERHQNHLKTSSCIARGLQPAASALEQDTWRSNLAFWRNRDRRCLVSNRYYEKVRSRAVRGHAVRDLDRAALAGLLADPDEPFRRPDVLLLKDSPSSTVAEFDLWVAGQPKRVIYKRFRVTSWSDPWKAWFRRPGALLSWIFGHGFLERRLPTARPLAVLHRQRGFLPREGYLLSEKIPDAIDLKRFFQELEALPPVEQRNQLRGCLEQLANLVRELHRRNLSHRDLKAANLLLSPAAYPGSCVRHSAVADEKARHVWLIDLVGVTHPRWLSRKRRVQNLARLHASFHAAQLLTNADKLRFLRVYLEWGNQGRAGWKRWWREIAAATAKKIERNRRSGRSLA